MSTTYGHRIVTDGLQLHLDAANIKSYPGTGTAWKDLSGNAHHLTLSGSPLFSTENCGNLAFNGSTQYTNYTTGAGQTSSWTINFWAYVTPAVQDGTNGWGTLLGTESNRLLVHSTAGYFLAQFGSGNHFSGYDNYMLSKWGNVTYVHDDTAQTDAFFVNGIHNGTDLTGTTANLNDFYIAWYGNVTYYKFCGKIASMSVYSRALTATEILQNFNANKGRFGL